MIAGRDVTYRYRVGEVWGVYSEGEAISFHAVREFRTYQGAETYQQELARKGRTALLQVGVLAWGTEEEAVVLLRRLHDEEGMRLT